MNSLTAKKLLILLPVVALALGTAGCSSTAPATTAAGSATDAPPADGQAAGDPANGNLAPAGAQGAVTPVQYNNPAPQPPNYSAPANQSAPAPASSQGSGAYDASYDADYDSSSAGQQPIYANDPPPPLPEYGQPPCPGDNYIWTPGVWSYGDSGYYWVPGAWIVAPYSGALWTPPYWEFYEHRYRWHHGYWGLHIGFYGGVNYGFGYVGRGFFGGYWRGGEFAYNREVTNINVNVIRSTQIYNYHVTNVTNTRVSYNGGPGGVGLRPTAPEIAVLHEQRMAPVAAQVQQVRAAQSNRAQFASVNHGRPAEAALAKPIETNYRAPAARPSEVVGHPQVLAPVARPAAQQAAGRPEPFARQAPQQVQRPQPMARQEPQVAGHPQPAARQEPQEVQRPQPAARPEPQQVQRPQPAARPEPQAHPQPAQRPQQAARPQPQPAPRPAAQRPPPAAHAEPHPPEKKDKP